MVDTNEYNLTEFILRHCYNCDNVCTCNEKMIAACMRDQGAEPLYDPEQTRKLLRLYEQ